MKKIYLLLSIFAVFTQTLQAQAPRFALFEHFTQAGCGPCADQNPAFQSAILEGASSGKVHHIAYHTSWPGTDPMYDLNPTENDDRVGYYGVSGVPGIFLNGNQKSAQPGGFSIEDVEQQFALSSPIKVGTSIAIDGAAGLVDVTISGIGTVPTGNYSLRIALIERNVTYPTPPGENGETYFPNVFRKMLPSIDGEAVTLPSAGSTLSYSYTFDINPAWNVEELHAIAFVQNNTTQEVLNSGADFDPVINYTLNVGGPSIVAGVPGTATTFAASSINTGAAEEVFTYTLSSNAPADWTSAIEINGTAATSPASVTTTSGSTQNINVSVTPGTTPGLIVYTLSVTSSSTPNSPPVIQTFYIISGVTDLIVNNSAGVGDGSGGSAANWANHFTDGLTAAGCTSYATTNEKIAERAILDGALSSVDYLYLNFGWTFPALTVSLSNALTQYANDGNIFVCGQDVAWAAFDPNSGQNPYVSPEAQAFLTSVMGVGYASDGVTGDNRFKPLAAEFMSPLGTEVTINNYYGGSNFFPDNLTLQNGGIKVASYVSSSKTAAVRKDVVSPDNTHYRTLYIAPGLEMLGTDAQKSQIMELVYDYLHGLITGIELDAAMQSLFGQNAPNPANNYTVIPFGELTQDAVLQITNVAGQIVHTADITAGSPQYRFETANLAAGTYFYQLSNTSGISPMKTLQVIH